MKWEVNLGIANILTIVFIVLKLCNVIWWSWWLVLMPSILLFALPMILVGAVFVFLFLVEFFDRKIK